jgi:multicomponent Na+:H+ antiporter subunit A
MVVTVGAAASMAGMPALLGFIGKEATYAALLDADIGGADLVAAGVVAGSVLTVAYSARFVWGALLVPRRRPRVGRPRPVPRPSPGLLVPAAVLAAAGLVAGSAPWLLDPVAAAAASSLDAAATGVHLALWHGFNLPLVLSTLTLVAGIGGYVTRRPVARLLATGRHLPSGSDAYLASLRGLNWLASRLTGVVQHGSLPIYVGVILLTAALLPVAALLLGGGWSGWPEVVDTLAHLPVAVVLVASAIAAAAQRRRISAVLFLGLTGYGMAALFVVQGAPDLALTQVAIETLSTILFVLVLRHLPARFERRSTPLRRSGRLAIAAAVGVAVFTFALAAGSARTEPPVSDAMIDQALPEGHGRNVVNVILVDFRGFDTLGEITVLAAAGIGAVALARAGRRPRPGSVDETAEVAG